MLCDKMIIDKIQLNKNQLQIAVTVRCAYENELMSPKLSVLFENGGKTRMIPMTVCDFAVDGKRCTVGFESTFLLDKLFYAHNISGDLRLSFAFRYGSTADDEIVLLEHTDPTDRITADENSIIIKNVSVKYSYKTPVRNVHDFIKQAVSAFIGLLYRLFSLKKIQRNKISFISCRRDDMSGNMKYVYDLLKEESDITFDFLMFSNPKENYRPSNIIKFLHLYATSGVVIVDDYFRLMNSIKKRNGVVLIQLWHACGAFKTFGYSRIGKVGGPSQTDCSHRMYDKAIVSSKNIAEYYCEGFGLSRECVVATGVPRTDIFFKADYSAAVKAEFYKKYPQLKNKKIILFAPTFRGTGQMNAYYDMSRFDPTALYNSLNGEYAILLKLHPFCREAFVIDDAYKDYIIDLSDRDELNDLLFVTHLLVTDYSSVVFEASLLEIPMVFYAYDLTDYIGKRDFYYDYLSFVPGKVVYSQSELAQCIRSEDFETERIERFKNEFFDSTDGLSSQRVVDLILGCIRGESV